MWNTLFKFSILALLGVSIFAYNEAEIEDKLQKGLEHYIATEEKSQDLEDALEALQFPNLFRSKLKQSYRDLTCITCKVTVRVIISARQLGVPDDKIVNVIIKLCYWLNIESEEVCSGTIHLQKDTVIYILDNKPNLTASGICSVAFQENGCVDKNRIDWTVHIPPQKTISEKNIKLENKKDIKILQLTDIHYDPEYEVGSNANCGAPLCCLAASKPNSPEDAAGYWGDYRTCDTPWHSVVNALQHIKVQHKDLDYVYFTGDIINHKVWDTNVTSNSEAMIKIYRELKKVFGSTPVYPVLGNHEPHPVNLFSSDGVDDPTLTTQWAFDLVAYEWQTWLPPDTKETILKGGYYSVLVKPGFRIVALNSNVCYTFNWWLIYRDYDPYDQLNWLVKVLLKAEEDGELVHILSHVPSGSDTCLFNWSREYAKITARFSGIISAQFNGHTHYDETVIFFNPEPPYEPLNVAFNGGSVTTWQDLNPNYKVYEVDAGTLQVQDFESWTYNITKANLNPTEPVPWYKLYAFKSAYNISDLSPRTLDELSQRMAAQEDLTQKYFRYKHREADAQMQRGCDSACEVDNLCYMVTYHPDVNRHCKRLAQIHAERK